MGFLAPSSRLNYLADLTDAVSIVGASLVTTKRSDSPWPSMSSNFFETVEPTSMTKSINHQFLEAGRLISMW